MRRRRLNPDTRRRRLERSAAQGDLEAALELDRILWRTGEAGAHYGAQLLEGIQQGEVRRIVVPDLFRGDGITLEADATVDPTQFSIFRARRLVGAGVPLSEQEDWDVPHPAVKVTATVRPGLPLSFYGGGPGDTPWTSWVASEGLHLRDVSPEASEWVVNEVLSDARGHEERVKEQRDRIELRNGPLTWRNVKHRIMEGPPDVTKTPPVSGEECVGLLREVAPPRQERLWAQPPNATGAGMAWAATVSLKHELNKLRFRGFRPIAYSGTWGPGRGDYWERSDWLSDWVYYNPFSHENTRGLWAHRSAMHVTTTRARGTQNPASVEAYFSQLGLLRPDWVGRHWFQDPQEREIPLGGIWRLRIGGPRTVQDTHVAIERTIRRLFPDAMIFVSSSETYPYYGGETWTRV